nr:MAG TPA: hypothetical protein [Bacteriophage sp.]
MNSSTKKKERKNGGHYLTNNPVGNTFGGHWCRHSMVCQPQRT